ncbi:glycosyltransferase [Fictibacillus sp. Mic-4]|uniref:glycosyltransferase n=1 Tax=Fictibacillus sp. Mic-4 TaxID=3132826 RepID=UPI003CEBF662
MAAGAPVISFNIKYGPHDVITNGIDGLLIDPNDIEALSDAMIELFINQEKRRLMGEEARKIADTLSDEKFAQEWLRVFEKASEQKRRRANLGKPQLTLTNVDYHNDEMKLEGTIAFPKGIESLQEDLKLSLYIRERTELIDQYLAAQVEWKDEYAAQFTSIFSLAGLAR